MIRRLVLLTIAVSLSADVLLHAGPDDLLLSWFSQYLDSLRAQAGIPGLAVHLTRLGYPDWERAYGQQDVEQSVAARPDTPFELDGTTQLLTAAMVLRCAEEGRLSLDDTIGQYAPDSAYAAATIRQVLTHTSPGPNGLVFSYRLDRLNPLVSALAVCTGTSFRAAVAGILDRLAMVASIPGSDVLSLTPPQEGFTAAALERYTAVFARLAKPYSVDSGRHATLSQYVSTSLTPAGGLISTVQDLASFDADIRKGVLVQPNSLVMAWTPPLDGNGQPLPHGIGWFVQSYNSDRLLWQFGVTDNASSSMIITVPGRGITMVLLANSQGLVEPFPLALGDITVSPFAKLFLSIFVR